MSVACPFNQSTCVLDLCSATHLLKSVLYTTGSQEITSPTAGVGQSSCLTDYNHTEKAFKKGIE